MIFLRRIINKKILTSITALSLIFSPVVLSDNPVQAAELSEDDYQQKLNNEALMSILWTQTSAEYRALCYQAYNTAMEQINKEVKKHKKKDKPLAIVLDIDDTILDTSIYDASFMDTSKRPTLENMKSWINSAAASPMPGAVEFLKEVSKKGVEIFYVTNRRAPEHVEGTINNLEKFDFPSADKEHVFLRTDSGSKQERFDKIAKDFKVIVYMGDNAGDFPLDTYGKLFDERKKIFDEHKKDFGTKFIVLPNPIYGSWEPAIAESYNKMSPEEKEVARRSVLRKWE